MAGIRRAVQLLFLLLFVGFLARPLEFSFGHLFKADILTSGSAALASLVFTTSIIFAAALALVTFVFGRVFCGWACPLGTFIDFLDYISGIKPRFKKYARAKYYILLLLVSITFGGVGSAWLVDPINWAAKLGGLVIPGRIEYIWIYILSGILILLSLILGKRGFCRVLCPLGALLALISRVSVFRRNVGAACDNCGVCADECRMLAIDSDNESWDRAECINCRTCDKNCEKNAISFSYFTNFVPDKPDLSKRKTLAALGAGAAVIVGLRSSNPIAAQTEKPLRPPGTVREDLLATLCIRCGSCIRACPTGGLFAAIDEAGPLLFQTPLLSGREGGCAWECNACGEVCPTGAIAYIPLEDKRKTRIGLAEIDEKRCIAYTTKRPCLVCYSSCPVEAIYLSPTDKVLPWKEKLQVPKIDSNHCTGCGLCEASCPVAESAVKVAALR